MSSLPKLRCTPQEYLEWDRHAEYRNEYVAGEILAMAGASREHNRITLNIGTALMEVLAPTTEPNDRGWKFAHYRRLATVKDYVMFSQYQAFAEHYTRRSDDQWVLTELRGQEAALRLPSIGCELPLSEIYARVELISDPEVPGLELVDGNA